MILRIRWKFLALLVLFAQFFEQGVILRHDCVRRGRSLWRVDGRWRHRDYVIGGWGDPVAILGMFGQVFLPVVLLAAITAGVAYCRVMCTLMTGQTGPVTQRFSADIANVPCCDWRWFEVFFMQHYLGKSWLNHLVYCIFLRSTTINTGPPKVTSLVDRMPTNALSTISKTAKICRKTVLKWKNLSLTTVQISRFHSWHWTEWFLHFTWKLAKHTGNYLSTSAAHKNGPIIFDN